MSLRAFRLVYIHFLQFLRAHGSRDPEDRAMSFPAGFLGVVPPSLFLPCGKIASVCPNQCAVRLGQPGCCEACNQRRAGRSFGVSISTHQSVNLVISADTTRSTCIRWSGVYATPEVGHE